MENSIKNDANPAPPCGSPQATCSGRQRFHCNFGIRNIQKGAKGKPATMTIEISNELAQKLMQALTGVGPAIYGPTIEWEEDQNAKAQ